MFSYGFGTGEAQILMRVATSATGLCVIFRFLLALSESAASLTGTWQEQCLLVTYVAPSLQASVCSKLRLCSNMRERLCRNVLFVVLFLHGLQFHFGFTFPISNAGDGDANEDQGIADPDPTPLMNRTDNYAKPAGPEDQRFV